MYPISDEFAAALKQPHTIVTRAEVLDHNFLVERTLNLHQGNVQVDGGDLIRRRCAVSLTDPTGELIPSDLNDLTHPMSNNLLRLWRGIRLPSGDEILSLGIFDIFDNVVSDTGEELKVEIKAFDFSKRVQRARLIRNYIVPAGQRYDLAIRDLISFVAPWVSFNFATVDAVTPFGLVFGSSGDQAGGDPWKYATEMAQSVGHELYFDIAGVCNLQPMSSLTQNPDWEYTEGKDSQLLYFSKTISKEDSFNHVFAFGENSQFDNPIKGEAWDDDPNSPTYRWGPYGSVPTFFVSPYIASVEQAQAVAEARLRQVLGATENLHMIVTPNPAHEIGDVVLVRRDRAKVNTKFVIDKFNINLAVTQAVNATVREIRSSQTAVHIQRNVVDQLQVIDVLDTQQADTWSVEETAGLTDSAVAILTAPGQRQAQSNTLLTDSLLFSVHEQSISSTVASVCGLSDTATAILDISGWLWTDTAWLWSGVGWTWSEP